MARLERSREELAKAWLVKLIERASLDQIRDLPTDRIASELPDLISDLLAACATPNGVEPIELTDAQARRAVALAELRGASESPAAELARDIASLQAVLLHALREQVAPDDPETFAQAAERLADATGAIQATAVEEIFRAHSRELESQANTDPLTGLHNLRFLQRQMTHLLELHKRYEHPFSVLLMDIDGLKRVNDAHGHQAGDRVLMQVAMSLQRSVRNVDTAARLGGDEFCVLAPNQGADAAVALAERLAAAAQDEVVIPDDPPMTLSIGVAACPDHGTESEGLVDVADRAMYRAKAAGERVAVGDNGGGEMAESAEK